jgi:hypothetical protein
VRFGAHVLGLGVVLGLGLAPFVRRTVEGVSGSCTVEGVVRRCTVGRGTERGGQMGVGAPNVSEP